MLDRLGVPNTESPCLSISEILFIRSRGLDDFQSGKNVLYCTFLFEREKPRTFVLVLIYLCNLFYVSPVSNHVLYFGAFARLNICSTTWEKRVSLR